MHKIKIKKGDQVIVIAGASKNKTGTVLRIISEKNRAVVEGVNMVKKHTKPSANNPQGGIVSKEAAIHISNIALLEPSTAKPTRVGYAIEAGKKQRIAKRTGKAI